MIYLGRPTSETFVFQQIWKSLAPLKVCAFSWQLLLDRISSQVDLVKRGAIPQQGSLPCPLCEGLLESSTHLVLAIILLIYFSV